MQIEGEIIRITYHNEQNGYTVATLSHNHERTIVVGKFFSINNGETVRLTGEFVTNKTYGEQFAFEKFEVIYPTTIKGIKSFLASGLIKGVGEITAQNIIDKFGKNSLEIIEFRPEKLAEISGISGKKALVINEYFNNYKSVQNIIVFLSEYGITTNLSLKIYEIYKNNTIKTIQESPYKLVEDVDGIGFLTADKIAIKFGIKSDSPFRIRAGLLYSLKLASERNGHTYLPKDELLKNLANLLNLSQENLKPLFEDILMTLALEKLVVNTNIFGTEIVALEKLYRHEKMCAERLALLNHTSLAKNLDVSEDIKHFEETNKISFHSEQINAIQTAINSGVCVITGGPGTGKTTIIKCILSILEAQGLKTMLLAPTGRASKRMSEASGHDASTIHRALAMDFATKKFYFDEDNPLDVSAVIVDEFSMVDASLAYYLTRAIPRDCKLIMVGDKDQLPSVGAGNTLGDIIKSETIKIAFLTQIFRQDDKSLIVSNAHKINDGIMPTFDNSAKDFFFETKPDLPSTANSIVSLVTERLPKFLNVEPSGIQVLAPLKSGVCGVESLNRKLQDKINPPSISKPEVIVGATILRKGDKIMQTSNNYNLEWTQFFDGNRAIEGMGIFNGDMGVIHDIDRGTGEVTVYFDGNKLCTYPRTEVSQITLAYAITIHKSQGSEFDAVVIPSISGPSIILNRNLIYTAVTRAKKMVVLVGEKKNLKTMINNKFILRRYTLLRKLLADADKKVAKLFDEG